MQAQQGFDPAARFHMPQALVWFNNYWAQGLSSFAAIRRDTTLVFLQGEARRPPPKVAPSLLQLEKASIAQGRPNAAK